MARRRHVYTGIYTESDRLNQPRILGPEFTRLANTYLWTSYSSSFHYIALATICIIVLLSYMLPNISQKIHRTNELKAMKKMIDVVVKEVSRAEVACLTMVDRVGCFQGSVRDGTTETNTEQHDLAIGTSGSMRATQSAPVQVEKKIGFFRRIFFPYKNTSNKEIAIMSYVYTDSFDKIKMKPEANPAEPRNI